MIQFLSQMANGDEDISGQFPLKFGIRPTVANRGLLVGHIRLSPLMGTKMLLTLTQSSLSARSPS